MKRAFCLLLLTAAALLADTTEVAYFKAVLSPLNEVPPANITASGSGTVRVNVVRNDAGRIVSGTVEFIAAYTMPGATTFTGMHIHNGPAGVNAGVTLSSGLSGQLNDETGNTGIRREAHVRPEGRVALDTLEGMFRDPSQFYFNIHTTQFPNGVIRGQLQRAEVAVLLGMMNSANEVPPTNINASGFGRVLILATRDASQTINNATAVFDVDYRFPSQTTMQGLHIHNGPAGVNAGVIIGTSLAAGARSVTSPENGVGSLSYRVEMMPPTQVQRETLEGLLLQPTNFYINLHTTVFTGGAIRAQLRPTDTMNFLVTMLPANEVPAIPDLNAGAVSSLQVNTLRGNDGNIVAAVATFNINYRFPAAVTITGLHVGDARAGANGGITVDSGISEPVISDTGFGNILLSRTFTENPAIASLNSLVRNPENHYLNLQTTVHPNGAVRSQLAAENTANPTVVDIISAVSDPSLRTGALGGLVTVFGRNLFKVPTDIDGLPGVSAPTSLNGTEVSIGGTPASIVAMGRDPNGSPPDFLVVQVPFESAGGTQPVLVRNSNGPAQVFRTSISAVSPAIYFDAVAGIALKVTGTSLAGVSLVRPDNAIQAGDLIALLVTGLGQTSPGLRSGQVVPAQPLHNTDAVTVTIGGRQVPALASFAVPGFVGAYLVAFPAPPGLARGNANVQIRVGTATSNTVTLPIG